jgi:hypothetical protein
MTLTSLIVVLQNCILLYYIVFHCLLLYFTIGSTNVENIQDQLDGLLFGEEQQPFQEPSNLPSFQHSTFQAPFKPRYRDTFL